MFNQFHDILGGCCIEEAYVDARNLHGRAMQTASEQMYFALQSITNQIRMPGKNPDNAWNLVLWNLNGFTAETEVEAEVQWAWEFDWYNGGIVLEDENGREIPCQIITEQCVVPKFRSRFVFRAELPPLGYRSYIVRQTNQPSPKKRGDTLENESLRIEYDSGGITAVWDKKQDRRVLRHGFTPYMLEDLCDTWGFNQTTYESKKTFFQLKTCKITESGPIRTTLYLEWEYEKSTLEQWVSLYETHIDCRYRVLWNEKRRALKFMVSNGREMDCVASAPYGMVCREKSVYEKPMGQWVMLRDAEQQIIVAADSVFAYQFDGSGLGLTVLRNCLFGDLRTEPLDPDREYRYMGQGVTEGRLRLQFSGCPEGMGILLNNPPVVFCEANHGGDLPPANSFFSCSADQLLLTALKKAEDQEAYVARLYHAGSSPTQADVWLFDIQGTVSAAPREIKTILSGQAGWKPVNMLEE